MRPRRRRILFLLIATLLPFILLAAVEGIFRLCGRGGYPPTFVPLGRTPRGTVIVTDTAGPASFFFTDPKHSGSVDQYALLSPKPPGTFRVMFCGESAAKGFPEPMAFASSAFLQAMLADLWPSRSVEVINLGTTAIASFPVLEIMTESLDYQPDLVVVYAGNNEFYGAYGVASLHTGGRSPAAIKLQRLIRSLGLVQALTAWQRPADTDTKGKTLMEVMMRQPDIGPNDSLRDAAAHNLSAHMGAMIDRCRARGVPIIVCTLACNERDLAPLGSSDDARNHYLKGRKLLDAGDPQRAAQEFQSALDLDPMPWRPPCRINDAIRDSAQRHGAVLCDVQQAYRAASPHGCIGWELMDDHVHPSLAGQALIARAIVQTLSTLSGTLAVDPAAFARLASNDDYARRLGDNMYDRYAVAHTMRVLFNVPFYRETNPSAYQRSDRIATDLESTMSPEIAEAVREWQKPTTHAGGQRPISGMVARVLIRLKRYEEAERLLQVAQRCVPLYSSWNLEAVYFLLACRAGTSNGSSEPDRQAARDAIARGRLLLARVGIGDPGMAERYMGRLHQLLGEYAEAIPLLRAARPHVSGTDLVGIDQALVLSYVKTNQVEQARRLIEDGIANSGEYAGLYRQMAAGLPK